MIKKYRFFPIWKLEEAERWLAEMESNGRRIDNVKFNFIWTFKESRGRNAQYFFHIQSLKDESMSCWPYPLLSDYAAQDITSYWSSVDWCRITKTCSLEPLIPDRLCFLQRYILRHILECSMFLPLYAFVLVYFISNGVSSGIIVTLLLITTSLLFSGYYLYGLFVQRKKKERKKVLRKKRKLEKQAQQDTNHKP